MPPISALKLQKLPLLASDKFCARHTTILFSLSEMETLVFIWLLRFVVEKYFEILTSKWSFLPLAALLLLLLLLLLIKAASLLLRKTQDFCISKNGR